MGQFLVRATRHSNEGLDLLLPPAQPWPRWFPLLLATLLLLLLTILLLLHPTTLLPTTRKNCHHSHLPTNTEVLTSMEDTSPRLRLRMSTESSRASTEWSFLTAVSRSSPTTPTTRTASSPT